MVSLNKLHFSNFRDDVLFLNRFKSWQAYAICTLGRREKFLISSRCANAYCPFTGDRVTFAARSDVPGAFLKTNHMLANLNSPHWDDRGFFVFIRFPVLKLLVAEGGFWGGDNRSLLKRVQKLVHTKYLVQIPFFLLQLASCSRRWSATARHFWRKIDVSSPFCLYRFDFLLQECLLKSWCVGTPCPLSPCGGEHC